MACRLRELDKPTARRWALGQPRANVLVARTMFTDAINDGLHPGPNPFGNLRLEQPRGRKDLIALSEDELSRLADCALDCLGSLEAGLRRQRTATADRNAVAARGRESVSRSSRGCIQGGSAPVGGILMAWPSSMSSSSCSSRRTKAAITSTRPIFPDCTRKARTSRKRLTTPVRRLACMSRVCAKKVARSVRASSGAGSPFPRERASAGRLRRPAHCRTGEAGLEAVRQRGSHVRLRNQDRATSLVVPLHRELKRDAQWHPQRRWRQPRRAARAPMPHRLGRNDEARLAESSTSTGRFGVLILVLDAEDDRQLRVGVADVRLDVAGVDHGQVGVEVAGLGIATRSDSVRSAISNASNSSRGALSVLGCIETQCSVLSAMTPCGQSEVLSNGHAYHHLHEGQGGLARMAAVLSGA